MNRQTRPITCRVTTQPISWALLLLARFALVDSIANANDNPFGFPNPIDPDRPGAVMLHGGGISSDDDFREDVRERFVELAGGSEARIVLMVADTIERGKRDSGKLIDGGETRAEFERRLKSPREYGKWADLPVASFQFAYRDPDSDKDDELICKALRQATGIWIPAYDQEWLPDLFAAEYPTKISPVVIALRNVLARGGVVGGLGGGMACLPETIIAEDLPNDGQWISPRVRFGLGLIDGVVVDKDFNEKGGRLERLTYLLRRGSRLNRFENAPGIERRTIGIGVSHFTTAILGRDSIEALGAGSVEVFLKSNGDRTITWHKLQHGDKVSIGSTNVRQTKIEQLRAEGMRSNLFGFPENDGQPTGTVVLHGGGNTEAVYELLPNLTTKPIPHLVHCPAARDRFRPMDDAHAKILPRELDEYFVEWRDLVRTGRLASLVFRTTNTVKDADREAFVEPLRNAQAVWFSGGDQQILRTLFIAEARQTLFQKELLNVLRRGGVVGGTSAGLAIMPATVIERGQNDNSETAVLSHGFGALRNVIADQHFDARHGRIKRLTNLVWNQSQVRDFERDESASEKIGIAVDEETALVVRPNHLEVHGNKFAHVFLRSKETKPGPASVTWHMLHPGDVANIWETTTGCELELEEWKVVP